MERKSSKSHLRALVILLALGFLAVYYANPQVIAAGAEDKDGMHLLYRGQPYIMGVGHGTFTNKLKLAVDYASWQNATFIFEPHNACVKSLHVVPAGSEQEQSVSTDTRCTEMIVDLRPYLASGENKIILDVADDSSNFIHQFIPDATLYINTQLLGADLFSSLGCLLMLGALAGMVFLLFRASGLDAPACWLTVAAFVYYALLLHYRPNLAYSNDYPGHIAYTRYMINDWMHPYGYEGWEHFHPPLYYFITARIFHLFSVLSFICPLSAVRAFGLVLYMMFCLFGLKTLTEAAKSRGMVYYTGVLLVLFWPVGSIMATRINNDLAVFATWAAAFYFFARWYARREPEMLQWALVMTGVTYMIKSNATVLLGTIGVTLCYMLVTRSVRIREFFSRRAIIGFAVLGFGIVASMGRVLYKWLIEKQDVSKLYLGDANNDWHPAGYYATFNVADYLEHPVVTFDKEPGFFNFFLKSVLYSEQQLGGFLTMQRTINLLFLILIIITIGFLALGRVRDRDWFKQMMPFTIAVVIAVAGAISFMVSKRYMFCQNFRYEFPALVGFIVLYVRGLENGREAGYGLLSHVGNGAGVMLALAGIALCIACYATGEL